jgi:hypothetical protein
MGYSLCWAAVKNGKPEAIHPLLGIRASDVSEEIAKSKIVGAVLLTDWYLVLLPKKELNDRILTKLCRLGEVVCCFVEDHVMFNKASGSKNGEFLRSVTHDCGKGLCHLEINGDAARSPKMIQAKLVDHIYEVPAELTKDLTGLRHDQDMPGMKSDRFQVLEKKPLLIRLLGARN